MTEMPNMTVVLVDPQTPGNVGFVARTLANFGVSRLRIVGADLRYNDDAQRFSMHAVDILESAEVFSTLEDAIRDVHASWAATARTGGDNSVTRALVPLTMLPNPNTLDGRVALVFGRETNGLTNEEIALCDLAFTIPVGPRYPSINLSHAVSIVLYDLFTRFWADNSEAVSPSKAATRRERDQACVFFDEVVDVLGLPEHRIPIAKRVFRNLVGRAYMTGREIKTMTGTVRVIRDKLLGARDDDQSVP